MPRFEKVLYRFILPAVPNISNGIGTCAVAYTTVVRQRLHKCEEGGFIHDSFKVIA